MKILARIAIIVIGYLIAVLVAASTLVVFIAAVARGGIADTQEVAGGIAFLGIFAAVFASPVAVPVIIAAEIFRKGAWWAFAAAGLAVGGLLSIWLLGLSENPNAYNAIAPLLTASTAGALAYWLIAWCLLAPEGLEANGQ